MKLKTTLFGQTYQFRDVKDVLAKANELRSGTSWRVSRPVTPRNVWQQNKCCLN